MPRSEATRSGTPELQRASKRGRCEESRRPLSRSSSSNGGRASRRSRQSRRRQEKRREPSSSSSTGSERRPKRSRRYDSQNMLLKQFVDIMKDMKNGGERDKFPILHNVIPEYDPMSKEQTIDAWINKVEECAHIYGWNDRQLIHYALPKLSGVAKSWYQGLPTVLFSWAEWKHKLKESFPTRENYADLLNEMLSLRVRYGESLELYYYSKMNLLNRCNITEKRAVDCLIAGIDDRGVRLGAQAVEFAEPEQVLKFFKTVKSGQDKVLPENSKNKDKDKRTVTQSTQRASPNPNNAQSSSRYNRISCHNCKEIGHPFFKCTKPKIQCTKCNWLGHLEKNCPNKKDKSDASEASTKTVMQINNSTENSNCKYKMPIKLNDGIIECHVDLGSEGTLIRYSDACKLGIKWQTVQTPLLKGLGNVPYQPLGLAYVTIEIQGVVQNDVEILVVADELINIPVLLGHTFTERPSIRIIKTATDVIFQKLETPVSDSVKFPLVSLSDVNIAPGDLKVIPVKYPYDYTGQVYIHGTFRGCPGSEHYLLPGEYQLKLGLGNILIQNITNKNIVIRKDELVTRGHNVDRCMQINIVQEFHESYLDESPFKCGDSITSEQIEILKKLLEKYKDCFSSNLKDLGFTTTTEMVINLKDSEPVVYRPYRLSQTERVHVRTMVQEMLDANIIRESNSPYASPIVLVNKKSGEKRLCVDYRALNRKTIREHYPLPRIEDQLDMLAGSSLFITLDMYSGYYQIPIAENSRDKTAFVTPDGQYEYNRMPFGLVNAPSVFQRTVNKILQKSQAKYALIFMDDVLIPACSFEEGITRLEEVLKLLREGGLTLKMSKCNFFFNKIDYLGFEVSEFGIRPGSSKIEAVSKFPVPKNIHEVRRFLGLASFFRRFVRGFATIARPLTGLLKKEQVWKWSKEESDAFEELKKCLIERPVLALYRSDAETQLHTDASKSGVAGILMQKGEAGSLQPVAYYSRQTTVDEQKLHSFELETLAVISSLSKFRVYLLGIKFKIVTDCNALRTTLTKRDLIPRIARWWVQFQEFDCEIEFRSGDKMAHVDALSRAPIESDRGYNDSEILDVLAINSEDWITTVQQADDEIKRISVILNDPKTKEIADVHNNYKNKNGRIYRIIDKDNLRWVVPKGARWQILRNNHDDVGHFAFEKTLERISSLYWFPKMRRYVKKYVSACMECAHHKLPSGAKAGELHPIPKIGKPFHTIHADHLGPFIRTKRGNTYILVIIDAFTKYINLTAVRNTKSATSVRVFREHISYFGTPSRLITDQGSSFTSKTFKDFIKASGIKHIYNAVATPRANGQVERYNRTILAALGAMNHDKPNGCWDEHLANIQLGINTTTHATTKKTPSELLFGINVLNPSQGKLNEIVSDILPPTTENNLFKIRSEVEKLIKEQQNKDKERFDKKRKKGVSFTTGDLVKVIRAVTGIEGQSKKLEAKCKGPYRIKKVLPNDRFVIEDTPLTKRGRRYEAIVSLDKISPWLSFSDPASDSNESTSDDESNDKDECSVPGELSEKDKCSEKDESSENDEGSEKDKNSEKDE